MEHFLEICVAWEGSFEGFVDGFEGFFTFGFAPAVDDEVVSNFKQVGFAGFEAHVLAFFPHFGEGILDDVLSGSLVVDGAEDESVEGIGVHIDTGIVFDCRHPLRF